MFRAAALTAVAVALLPACTPTRNAAAPSAAPTTDSPSGAPSSAVRPAPSRSPTPTATRTYVPAPRYPTPRALVAALVRADRVVHDRGATAAALAAAGQAQQQAYRQLAVTPGWRADVYAALPARLRADARACVTAAESLRAMTRPQPRLPAWRIVPAPPRADLLRYYRESGRRHGVDWSYLAAIHLVETRMGRLRGVSTAGARGPMQFLPSTWAEVGRGDIDDPRDAIDAAARYLVRRGAHESIARAVRGYNPSDDYVRAVLAYAEVLRRDPATYRGFYHWQVYYRSTSGDVVLLEGYRGGPGTR